MKNFLALGLLSLFILINTSYAMEECDTAGELMTLNLLQRDFIPICKQIVNSDPACTKIKPEKRLTCTSKSANTLAFDGTGSDFANRTFQCVKGFVWDTMEELVKFVGQLITSLVGSGVKNNEQIIRFMIDPFYRSSVISKSAAKGGKLGAAFLKGTFSYVAREYPKNALKHPFSPISALGATLEKPLVKFLTDAVQNIIKEYVPQYQCMNGAAKLNTICRIAGEFLMPPVFIINFLKFGIKGVQALSKSAAVVRFTKNFKALNEIPQTKKVSKITLKSIEKKPKPLATGARNPHQAKPITKYTDAELTSLARTESVEARRLAVPKETVSILDSQADEMFKSAQKEDLVDWDVLETFEPQTFKGHCGLASVCSVLKHEHPELSQEQIMLNNAILKKPQEVVGLEGMSPDYELDNLAKIVENNGKTSLIVRADENEAEGIAKLREDVIESLKDPGKKVIANYDGIVLGVKTAGHYSPIAGFDPISDRILVLDVASRRNEHLWVPVSSLYKAMAQKDSYGFARGYLKIDTPTNSLKRMPWKDFSDVMNISGLSEADGRFLKSFLDNAPKDLQDRLLIKFQTQSSEATLKDLESMRDLSRINGECR